MVFLLMNPLLPPLPFSTSPFLSSPFVHFSIQFSSRDISRETQALNLIPSHVIHFEFPTPPSNLSW